MSGPVMVCCSSCRGSGKRRLPTNLAEVFDLLDANWRSTETIGERYGADLVTPNALANRLVRLVGFGIVERRDSPTCARVAEWRRAGDSTR